MSEPSPLQMSVTRIAAEVYRIIVQSHAKVLYTAIVEKKHVISVVERELDNMAVITPDEDNGAKTDEPPPVRHVIWDHK